MIPAPAALTRHKKAAHTAGTVWWTTEVVMERGVFGSAQRSLSPGIGPCLRSVSPPVGGVLLGGCFSEQVSGGRVSEGLLGSHRL